MRKAKKPIQALQKAKIVVLLMLEKGGARQVRNGFRHTAGSMWAVEDAQMAARQLGHLGGGVDTLLMHYRRLATPEMAAEYWSIMPKLANA